MMAALFIITGAVCNAQTEEENQGKRKNDKSTGKVAEKQDEAREEIPEMNPFFEAADPYIEEKPGGSVNWTDQYVQARGESVIDTVRFKNKAQARAMAVRGAVVVAQRNLLEIVNGVRVHGETTVENMITTSDVVYTRVDGLIRGAEMVGEPVEEYGMMVVKMKVPIYQQNGLAGAVYPTLGESLKSSGAILPGLETGQKEQMHESGRFVFNMGGLEYDPAMFPVITDEEGNILLDLTKIYNPDLGKFPQILKTSRELMSEIGFEKGVEVIDVVDSFDGRLVVDKKAKKRVDWGKVASTVAKIGKILLLFI